MNVRNILAKKRDFMIVLMAIALIACSLSGCGSSTGTLAGITRLDDEGYLYRDTSKEEYYTVMPESAALVILQSAVQNPHTNASGISMTQYSAIYNNEKKTVEVWPFQNYSKSFIFDVTGNQVPAGK